MNNLNYPDLIIKQSQAKFRLMKKKMLEPIITRSTPGHQTTDTLKLGYGKNKQRKFN